MRKNLMENWYKPIFQENIINNIWVIIFLKWDLWIKRVKKFAVCYNIVASPALSGTINLPSPFSPITDQHWSTAALDLPLLPLHPQPVQEASPAPILAMEKTVTDSVAALQKCDEVWACHISITYQSLPLAINEDHEFGTGVTHELAEGQRCSGRGDCHGPLEDCLQMTIKVCIS